MNPSSPERARSHRRIRTEAAVWIARLHGPGRARQLESGFRRWLAEDPAHAAEFELATDAWNETEGISFRVSDYPTTRRHNQFAWRVGAGLAACLLLAIWFHVILSRSVVSTGVGEQKTISLSDGSRVTLNTNTRLVVQYSQRARTIILRYGEAYFQVVHNQRWPFVVRVGDQKIIDVGTSFIVRRSKPENGPLSVTVIEGRVAVAPLEIGDVRPKLRPLKATFVSAGNRLLLSPNMVPSIQAEATEQATAWLRGQLVFDNTTLDDAVAEFNRYNSIKIVLSAPHTDQIRVGGVFRTGSSESFARSVAQAHRLKLVIERNALVLEPSEADAP